MLLVLALAVGSFFYLSAKEDEQPTNEAVPERSGSDDMQLEDLSKDPENKERAPNSDSPPPPDSSAEPRATTVQMVSSATVTDRTLHIRGGINTKVADDGTCYAELTGPDGSTQRINTTLLQNPHTTDCETISVDITDYKAGKWSVKLRYASPNYEGASNGTTFDI